MESGDQQDRARKRRKIVAITQVGAVLSLALTSYQKVQTGVCLWATGRNTAFVDFELRKQKEVSGMLRDELLQGIVSLLLHIHL